MHFGELGSFGIGEARRLSTALASEEGDGLTTEGLDQWCGTASKVRQPRPRCAPSYSSSFFFTNFALGFSCMRFVTLLCGSAVNLGLRVTGAISSKPRVSASEEYAAERERSRKGTCG